jgi:hypothetical protein
MHQLMNHTVTKQVVNPPTQPPINRTRRSLAGPHCHGPGSRCDALVDPCRARLRPVRGIASQPLLAALPCIGFGFSHARVVGSS